MWVSIKIHLGAGDPSSSQGRVGATAGLRIQDMIICVNGKVVGGMTETDLEVELELAGQDLVLVVSRCILVDAASAGSPVEEELRTWSKLDRSMNGQVFLDWNDIGTGVERSGVVQEAAYGNEMTRVMQDVPRIPVVVQTTAETTNKRKGTFMSTKTAKRKRDREEAEQKGARDGGIEKKGRNRAAAAAVPSAKDRKEPRQPRLENRDKQVTKEAKKRKTKSVCSVAGSTASSNGRIPAGKTSRSKTGEGRERSAAEKKRREVRSPLKGDESSIDADEGVWDGDEVPWLGCVCGETHPKPIVVFWIQVSPSARQLS